MASGGEVVPTTQVAGQRRGAGNRLLAALSRELVARLDLQPVELTMQERLVEVDRHITHVEFIESGVVALVAARDATTAIEVATIGNEGMIGVPVFLGASSTRVSAIVEIPGTAQRMPADAFRSEIDRGGELRDVVQHYTSRLLEQIAREVTCRLSHDLLPRCARALLTTHDRLRHAQTFTLPRVFLAQTLGTAPADLDRVTSELQATGAIEYVRGLVTVLGRPRLEAQACPCYRASPSGSVK